MPKKKNWQIYMYANRFKKIVVPYSMMTVIDLSNYFKNNNIVKSIARMCLYFYFDKSYGLLRKNKLKMTIA